MSWSETPCSRLMCAFAHEWTWPPSLPLLAGCGLGCVDQAGAALGPGWQGLVCLSSGFCDFSGVLGCPSAGLGLGGDSGDQFQVSSWWLLTPGLMEP